jgi:hypothetical protein
MNTNSSDTYYASLLQRVDEALLEGDQNQQQENDNNTIEQQQQQQKSNNINELSYYTNNNIDTDQTTSNPRYTNNAINNVLRYRRGGLTTTRGGDGWTDIAQDCCLQCAQFICDISSLALDRLKRWTNGGRTYATMNRSHGGNGVRHDGSTPFSSLGG